jgi:large subunit ribosomal protein L24
MPKVLHVKKGDKVVILTGRDKGKQGTILEVLPKKDRVVVDGINIVKKHQKPRPPAEPEGGIKEIPAPIHASNVKKVETKSKKAAKKSQAKKK